MACFVACDGDEFFGYAKVALAEGGVFEQLAEAVAVAFRELDVFAFDYEPALRLASATMR